MADNQEQDSAFVFSGNWKDYAPIALTNLLLTIVTLGVYRFWAKTRERQYLWSHTRFIDDRLEWTGTGKELFVGFTIAAFLFLVPILILKFGLQALAMRGYLGVVVVLGPALYLFLMYIFGLARFRALRYRLSRTYWHGIRGGSDDQGWGYGWSSVWKTIVGSLPAGLLIPWSMCELWNERWNKMSFGPHPFVARIVPGPLMGRFLLFYLLPLAGCVVLVGGAVAAISTAQTNPRAAIGAIGFIILGAVAVYLAIGVIALAYYAKFFREAVGKLSLTRIDFAFTARTMDWLTLFFIDVVLVIGTLGIGYAWLGYRHWKFFITYLEATGEVDLAALTQSSTRAPKQGEGLLDAFDVGAF